MVHLPALNTPQFELGRTKLPRHPQPVPPIYQPEVAAEAIVWVSEHRRRELYVGAPTLKTVLGNQIAPGLADRYLARTGYEGQQTDEPVDPRPARQPVRAGAWRPRHPRPVRRRRPNRQRGHLALGAPRPARRPGGGDGRRRRGGARRRTAALRSR